MLGSYPHNQSYTSCRILFEARSFATLSAPFSAGLYFKQRGLGNTLWFKG